MMYLAERLRTFRSPLWDFVFGLIDENTLVRDLMVARFCQDSGGTDKVRLFLLGLEPRERVGSWEKLWIALRAARRCYGVKGAPLNVDLYRFFLFEHSKGTFFGGRCFYIRTFLVLHFGEMGGLRNVTTRYIWCLRGAYVNLALRGGILSDMRIPPLISPLKIGGRNYKGYPFSDFISIREKCRNLGLHMAMFWLV